MWPAWHIKGETSCNIWAASVKSILHKDSFLKQLYLQTCSLQGGIWTSITLHHFLHCSSRWEEIQDCALKCKQQWFLCSNGCSCFDNLLNINIHIGIKKKKNQKYITSCQRWSNCSNTQTEAAGGLTGRYPKCIKSMEELDHPFPKENEMPKGQKSPPLPKTNTEKLYFA